MEKHCDHCGKLYQRPAGYSATQWANARFCSRHCRGWGRHKKIDATAKFYESVFPEPMSGCWLWDGTLHVDGYGQVGINGRLYRAHRLSYEIHKGAIPSGLGVLHHCDNRACVNPDHLYAGTPADNAIDMAARSRSPVSKLTTNDVKAIRASDMTNAELARQFSMSRNAIRNVRAGKTWGWLR